MADIPPAADATPSRLAPGQLLARGVGRHLYTRGFAVLEEVTLADGLRVDIMGLGPKGEVWVAECKSSRADFLSDMKWQGYLGWCDRFFFAVGTEFPVDLLPGDAGLIYADAWDAAIERMPSETPLVPARRKALTLRFARAAAGRVQALRDPFVTSAF